MNNDTVLTLSQSQFFKEVNPEDFKKLFSKHNPLIKRYKKGKTFKEDGSYFDKLIIISEGSIKRVFDSKTIEYKPFEAVALDTLFSEERILSGKLIIDEDTKVIEIEREALTKCCQENILILENTLTAINMNTLR